LVLLGGIFFAESGSAVQVSDTTKLNWKYMAGKQLFFFIICLLFFVSKHLQ